MGTGIEVSLEAAIAACLLTLALGALIGRGRHIGQQAIVSDPLTDLFAPRNFGKIIDGANRRAAGQAAAQAVVHGRIDQTATLHAGWNLQAREEFLGHVSAVMKAGIRHDDTFIRAEGAGFTIVMPGADERAAKGVAERLRGALALIRLPQFGSGNAFTASFGVAAGTAADRSKTLVARALAAVEAAQTAGVDHIVVASEMQDVIFLPAPDRSAEAA
ncbi:GGDEF domain-containing protein [Erythrobacter sp. NFXS35]|uniref:GGDEF domain-containing protein n=1 Tax=Erythrobacter sp. NFXS35 TaxID=2818436 RepID=UPI0032DF7B3D